MIEALIGLAIYAVIMGIASKVKRDNRIKQIEVECAARAELFRNVTLSTKEKKVSEEQKSDYEERKKEILFDTVHEKEDLNYDMEGLYDDMSWLSDDNDNDDDEEDTKWLYDDDDDMKWLSGDDDDEMDELYVDADLFGDTGDGMSDSSRNSRFPDFTDKEVGLHVGMDIISDDWDLW